MYFIFYFAQGLSAIFNVFFSGSRKSDPTIMAATSTLTLNLLRFLHPTFASNASFEGKSEGERERKREGEGRGGRVRETEEEGRERDGVCVPQSSAAAGFFFVPKPKKEKKLQSKKIYLNCFGEVFEMSVGY